MTSRPDEFQPPERVRPDVERARVSAADESVVRRPLLVTIPEAALVLAVGRSTIYHLIWTGQLTPIHIGRSVRLALEQLENFVEGHLSTDGEPSQPV
jgi:excisionase family DNA binding protein